MKCACSIVSNCVGNTPTCPKLGPPTLNVQTCLLCNNACKHSSALLRLFVDGSTLVILFNIHFSIITSIEELIIAYMRYNHEIIQNCIFHIMKKFKFFKKTILNQRNSTRTFCLFCIQEFIKRWFSSTCLFLQGYR